MLVSLPWIVRCSVILWMNEQGNERMKPGQKTLVSEYPMWLHHTWLKLSSLLWHWMSWTHSSHATETSALVVPSVLQQHLTVTESIPVGMSATEPAMSNVSLPLAFQVMSPSSLPAPHPHSQPQVPPTPGFLYNARKKKSLHLVTRVD